MALHYVFNSPNEPIVWDVGHQCYSHKLLTGRDITGILHTLNEAYETLYNTLLQDVSMDVSTEIDTLEAMLRQDGLTHNFESDFNTRS